MKFWIISSNEVLTSSYEGQENVIKRIHWRRRYAKENQFTDDFGVIELPEPNMQNFIPYSNLTFDQYCVWLDSLLNVNEIDMKLDIQMEKLINPPTKTMNLPFETVVFDNSNYPGLKQTNM